MGTWLQSDAKSAFAAIVVAAVFLPACRAGCGPASDGAPGVTFERVARVHVSGEDRPGPAAIDDDGDGFLVAGSRGPLDVWSEGATGDAPAASLSLSEPISSAGSASTAGPGVVFVATESGTLRLWSWKDRRMIYERAFGGRSLFAALAPDARYLAHGAAVFDRQTGDAVGRPVSLSTQSAIAYAAGGGRVAIAGFHEARIFVRDLPSGAVRDWLAPEKVGEIALDARGEIVAAATDDGRIHMWRQPGGEPAGAFASGASGGAGTWRGLRFVRGDRQLIVADHRGISLCDVAGQKMTWRETVSGEITTFAVSGDLAAAGTTEGAVVVWDLSTPRRIGRTQTSTRSVASVAVSARRHRLVAVDEAGEATLWRW